MTVDTTPVLYLHDEENTEGLGVDANASEGAAAGGAGDSEDEAPYRFTLPDGYPTTF
jgi:hypothetical protein